MPLTMAFQNLRKLVTAKQGGRNLAANTAWLLGERVVSLSLALATGILVARYLGPHAFGQLSYAIALVGLFGTFTYLGLNGVATRDLVAQPGKRQEILGTTFALKLAGALVATSLVIPMALLWEPDPQVRTLLIVLACALPFDAMNVISLWYYSRTEAKYAVVASIAGALVSAALKVGFVVGSLSLKWFAIATATQNAVTGIALLGIYFSQGCSPAKWQVRREQSQALLAASWPLAVAAVIATIYLKIDQVMLAYFASHEAVGTYAVAARLSEVWYLFPAAISTSVFPSIVKASKMAADEYRTRMRRLYTAMFYLSLSIAIPISFTSDIIIGILYGPDFHDSGTILTIHIWACPAMFMGAILTKWLITEGRVSFVLIRDCCGAALNVILNLILIPSYAGVGAAVATVISYSISNLAIPFVDRRTRPAGIIMAKSILHPVINFGGWLATKNGERRMADD